MSIKMPGISKRIRTSDFKTTIGINKTHVVEYSSAKRVVSAEIGYNLAKFRIEHCLIILIVVRK